MKNIILISLQLLFCTVLSFGQMGFTDRIGDEAMRGPSIKELENTAFKARQEGDAFTAMQYYKRIIDADSTYVPALMGFAGAATDYSALELAEKTYVRVLALKPDAPDVDAVLRQADIKMRLSKFDESRQLYQSLVARAANLTPKQMEDMQSGLESTEWAYAIDSKINNSAPLIFLDKGINTLYSEISPAAKGDTIYFAKQFFEFTGDKHQPKRRLARILAATPSADTLQSVEIGVEEKDKSVANPTFSADGTVMYYAACQYVNDGADQRCELYMRIRDKGSNVWSAPVRLPDDINVPGANTTQPHLAKLPGDTEETLFFASDRPGGKGRSDVWSAKVIMHGKYGAPINMAAINTPADEITPSWHAPSRTLYFSTDGRNTLGGYDVYKTNLSSAGWSAPPDHLGAPVNSGANDVSFSLTPAGATAYMATNRRGVRNATATDACCYDIVQVNLQKPRLIAIAIHKITRDTLTMTEMAVTDMTGGQRGKSDRKQVAGKIQEFEVLAGKSYELKGLKAGFVPGSKAFATPGYWNGTMVQIVELRPVKVDMLVRVFDAETKKPLFESTAYFSDMMTTSKDGTVAVETNTNKNGNEYAYPLRFDRDYRVIVGRNGYTTDTVRVDTRNLMEDKTFIDTVYLQRGVDLQAFVFDESRINLDVAPDAPDQFMPLRGATFRLIEIKDDKERIVDEKTSRADHTYSNFLKFDHRYRILAYKSGFTRDSLEFNVTDDEITNDTVNGIPIKRIIKKLLLHPSDLNAYLPMKLYFDNDHPAPKTVARTTELLYSQTYFPYYRKKQEYVDNIAKESPSPLAPTEQAKVSKFFEGEVKAEWNKLRFFTEILFDKLKKGEQIEITLEGFASPRAATDYNKNLTARRINTVMNHFRDFDGELLRKFVESGQLVVTEEPKGEDSAPAEAKQYSDADQRSIHSVEASRERRVEIIRTKATRLVPGRRR
jgi:WD40-like Beta Propeller Repeat